MCPRGRETGNSRILHLAVCAAWVLPVLAVAPVPAVASGFSDDFEDGVIDTSLWITHGYKGGYPGGPSGVGLGGWQYSIAEVPAADGYLQARVWGPTSGNTYGAEAWVRSTQNFNDGGAWLVNFTWATSIAYTRHCDSFLVQITDGAYSDNCDWAWTARPAPVGSANLYNAPTEGWSGGVGDTPIPPFSKQTWSLRIDPAGSATLYQAANAQGPAYKTVSLGESDDWYVRFVLNAATSSGFPAGDNSFKLYDFSAIPEPASLGLLALGGLALIRRRRK